MFNSNISSVTITVLPEENSLIGDVNEDGVLDVIDIVSMVNLIMDGSYNLSADSNEDGVVDIIDIIILLNWILDGTQKQFGSLESFDLLTWNIEDFPKHTNTINELTNIIPVLKVDIIALQEIESSESLEEEANSARYWLVITLDTLPLCAAVSRNFPNSSMTTISPLYPASFAK